MKTKKKKAVLTTVIVICTLIAVAAAGLCVFFFAAPAHDDIIMIGHRGYSSKFLDNTCASFINAAEHGSAGVETDVRYTADGVYVLSHDSEVELADGTLLPVSESTFAELTAQPLKNDTSNDVAYLCTLKDYLLICKEYNMICFIELKGDYNTEQIRDVFTYIQDYYTLDMCELQSFDFDVLVEAQKMFPDLHFMLTWGSDRGDYTKCFDYGFDIDASYWSLSPELVKEFHSRGLKVATWTCNDIFSLYYSYWYKVDYIESDVF